MKTLLSMTIISMLLFGNIENSFSWDTTAAKLYPMTIGNVWSCNYKIFAGPGGCVNLTSEQNYLVSITRDTLMPNSKRYFVFESSFLGTSYRRIDSVKMNIYQYSTSSGNECLYDSLRATTNSTFGGCNTLVTVVSISTMNIFGANRTVKVTRPLPCPGCGSSLVEGIGFYDNFICLTSGNRTILNGCIVNGIQYGQILGINQISSEIPVKFELSQNYPNPFNPVTKIRFQIPLSRGVTETDGMPAAGRGVLSQLIIYDALGREVQTLVNENLSPGTYEVNFDGNNLPSGVYFYTLSAGHFRENRKMILVK